MKERSMHAAQQTNNAAAPLMRFYSDDDQRAWLNGRSADQLEIWQQACVECGYLPPATKAEFMEATRDDAVYPDLEAWRVAFMTAQFEANVREKMGAAGAPAGVIDEAIAKLREQLGAKMADVSISDVKMVKLTGTSAKELDSMPPDMLAALLGDDQPPYAGEVIKLISDLIDVEKSRERAACAKLIEAMDPEAGKRFADAIRVRDEQERSKHQCDCEKCTVKRAAAAMEPATN
jgi:hypothetical protein